MSDLFSKQRWTGVFFPPGAEKNRFCGEINYSPEEGVTLSYTIVNRGAPHPTKVLHGILSDGNKCTLIGHFDPSHANKFALNKNGTWTCSGEGIFQILAIGDYLDEEEEFTNVSFSLTNLKEFFPPTSTKDLDQPSEQHFYVVTTTFGEIKITNTTDYRIFLDFSPHLVLRCAYQHISDLSELFALLFYSPVYPDSTNLIKLNEDNQPVDVKIYPSMALNPRTIEIITHGFFRPDMPITKSTISLASAVDHWLRLSPRPDIVSSIQHETGFRDKWAVRGEIVIYAAQLESISHKAKQGDKKYEYPLTEFATKKIRDGLMSTFGKESLEDVGMAIGELRNEIAHVGRRKDWLNSLPLHQLIRISEYLRLTIFGYVLSDIKIPKNIIDDYQDKFAPRI